MKNKKGKYKYLAGACCVFLFLCALLMRSSYYNVEIARFKFIASEGLLSRWPLLAKNTPPTERVRNSILKALKRHKEVFKSSPPDWVRAAVEGELEVSGKPRQSWQYNAGLTYFRALVRKRNEIKDVIVVFRIHKGSARVIHETHKYKAFRIRAYLNLFTMVARYDRQLSLTIWVSPKDRCPGNNVAAGMPPTSDRIVKTFPNVPIFCFQRFDENKHAILLPEIQMLYSDFYSLEREYKDRYVWEKKNGRIPYFRGSITGPGEGLHNQRIRVCSGHAVHEDLVIRKLHNRSHVDCALFAPNTSDVHMLDALRKNGTVILEETSSWDDAVKHKYLLLLDGHGASCLRVFRVLISNSVALKMETTPLVKKSSLFYFYALEAWKHFVPVNETNMLEVVQVLERNPEIAKRITQDSTEFAQKHITREMCIRYTHLLLTSFVKIYQIKNTGAE